MTQDPRIRTVKRRGVIFAEVSYNDAQEWSADDLDSALESHGLQRDTRALLPQYKKDVHGSITHVLIAVQPA